MFPTRTVPPRLRRTLRLGPLALALALVALAACPAPAGAEAVGEGARAPLTLSAALARAMRDNPDLREARARLLAARGDRRGAWLPPDPTFTYTPGSPAQSSLAEPIDLGPQRIFRTAQAGHAANAAHLDVADAERLVRFQVRQGFFDVLLADTLAAIARDEAAVLAGVAAADSARLASGDAPEREVTRSAIEAAEAQAAAERAEASARTARYAFEQLLGMREPDPALALAGTLAWSGPGAVADSLGLLVPDARPDLAAAAERAAAARAERRLAWSDLLPVPQLSWVHQDDAPFPNGSHDAIGVGVSVPVFSLFGGERDRAAADVEQASVEASRARSGAESGLLAARDAFVSSRALALRYGGGLLDRAGAALEAARFAYARGAVSQLELFDAVRADHQVRAGACTALHDWWVSAYALDRETGKEIVR